MCLFPRTVPIRYRRIGLSYQPEYISINCGYCEQCSNQKRDEYTLRTYYEALECFSNDGFIFYDTLTYNESHVPKFYHFDKILNKNKMLYAFSNEHIKYFFKRLRRKLFLELCKFHHVTTRSQFAQNVLQNNVKGKLRYILVSEYGDDERYTHHSHYHVMFYCSIPNVDNILLKKCINFAWRNIFDLIPDSCTFGQKSMYYQYGKDYDPNLDFGSTDTIGSKLSNYSKLHHNTIDKYQKNHLGVYGYISKYMVKDSFRIEYLLKLFQVNKISELPSEIRPFHRQSLGYGRYLLELIDIDPNIHFTEEYVILKDLHNPTGQRTVKLPQYYIRKSFYDTIKDFDGSIQFVLNDKGIEHKISNFPTKLKNVSLHLRKSYDQCPAETQDYISYILNDRTFEDLAFYQILLKGKRLSPKLLENFSLESLFSHQTLKGQRYKLFETTSQAKMYAVKYAPTLFHSNLSHNLPFSTKGFDHILSTLYSSLDNQHVTQQKRFLDKYKYSKIQNTYFKM